MLRSRIFRSLLIVIGGLLAVYLALVLMARPAPSRPFFAGGTNPLVIAHQGGDGEWPGETLYAYQQSAALGVDVLEMDIHLTRDGTIVLMHDATVDRTTDGAGEIRQMTLAELKQLDAAYDWSPDEGQTFPYRGQGLPIATLDEVFAAFPDFRMNIEIKQVEPSLAAPFCTLLHQHQMLDKVLVASFKAEAMNDFRQACPEAATSAVEDEVRTFFILNTLFLSRIYSPASQAVQVPEYSGELHVLTPGFIAAAHQRNLDVHVWTVNATADMQRMLELGVDGVITDYPTRLMTLLGR